MECNLRWLCGVEVISVKNGINLGRIDDICFDTENARIARFVIFGKRKLFGLLGRYPDITVKWGEIKSFGQDVLLVDTEVSEDYKKPNSVFKIY